MEISRLVIAALTISLASCGGAAERKAKYLEKGQLLYEQGNYEKAQLELRNVLQIDPKDSQARFLLGKVLEQKQEYPKAAGHYLALIEQNPNSVDARVRLGRLYLLGRAPDRAMKEVEEVMKLAPDRADAFALRGGIRAMRGDLSGATDDGERALAIDPTQLDAISLLAGIHTQQKRPEKAVALLGDAVARDPKNVVLRALMAEVYAAQGKDAEAVAQLEQIIQQEPDRLGHRIRLASYHVERKQIDKAESVLRDAADSNPTNGEARLTLVRFVVEHRGNDAAQKEIASLLARQPDDYALRFEQARLYQASKDIDKAKAIYKSIIADDRQGPDGLRARNHVAALLLHSDKREQAAALLEEVLEKNPRDNDALLMRARLAMARGQAANAIIDLRAVMKDQPDAPDVLSLLALAHSQNREPQLALDVLRGAVDANPRNEGLRIQLAQELRKSGDQRAALDQYQEVLKRAPGHMSALEATFRIHLAKQNWRAAEAVLQQIRKHHPDDPLGHYLAGVSFQMQGQHARSISEFELALKQAPQAADALSALVQSHLVLKQPAKARERVKLAIAKAPESALLHGMLGEIYMIEGQLDEAATVFHRAITLDARMTPAYRGLATVFSNKGDKAAAERTLKEGIAATGEDLSLIAELASFYQRSDQQDAAIAQYEAILRKAPGSQVASNNLAMLLVTYRTDKKSIDRAYELAEFLKSSDNPAFLDTFGWVEYKRGALESAISAFERAVARTPDEPLLRYHLGMAYYKKGDAARAREHLERSLQAKSSFHGVDEAKATLAKIAGG